MYGPMLPTCPSTPYYITPLCCLPADLHGSGAAVYMASGDLHINNSLLQGNTAWDSGGAVYCSSAQGCHLHNSAFKGNKAVG